MIHIFQRHTTVLSIAGPLYESLFCVTTYTQLCCHCAEFF